MADELPDCMFIPRCAGYKALASRLTAAQEQVERLREALRREMVTDYYCEQCDRGWMEENVEIHAPGCLAAKDRP